MVTNVYMKFNYDPLHIDKALLNFQTSDNKKMNKNNVRSTWGPFMAKKICILQKCTLMIYYFFSKSPQ